MDTYVYLRYLAGFILEWEMFQKKRCREDQNTHFMFINVSTKIESFMW